MYSSVGVEFWSYVGVKEEVLEALSREKFGGKRLVDVDCTLASTTCAPKTGFSFRGIIAGTADSMGGIENFRSRSVRQPLFVLDFGLLPAGTPCAEQDPDDKP